MLGILSYIVSVFYEQNRKRSEQDTYACHHGVSPASCAGCWNKTDTLSLLKNHKVLNHLKEIIGYFLYSDKK